MTSFQLIAGITVAMVALVAIGPASGAGIVQVPAGELTGTQVATFEEIAAAVDPGTSVDTIVVSGGVGFAERFVGQTVVSAGDFDVPIGAPTPGLALAIGSPGRNLVVDKFDGRNVIGGLGSLGFPTYESIGEGSMAVLFSTDQSEVGFDLFGTGGGPATFEFYRRDGSRIDTITLTDITDRLYGFQREGGVHDIAGVLFHNTDDAGMAFDAVRFDIPSAVPEPTTVALMALGLGFVAATSRRRRASLSR